MEHSIQIQPVIICMALILVSLKQYDHHEFLLQVFGLYVVKLSVAVVVAGGTQKVDNSGIKVRGEPHLLLIGDPGEEKCIPWMYVIVFCSYIIISGLYFISFFLIIQV